MTAMPAAQAMTAPEYLAMPRREGWVWNLVEGEVVITEPSFSHQQMVVRLVFGLEEWIRAGGGGAVSVPIDIGIDERNVYQPDVCWYPAGREPCDDERPYPVPHIAAEVRSPSTWRHDIGAKKSGYERSGLQELWLVDTDASEILVFRRSTPTAATFDVSLQLGTGEVLTSPLLPGFALPLESVF